MRIDENRIVIVASLFAVVGISLLFLLSETPQDASVAQALVAQENSLLRISGEAANLSGEKFSLCDRLCITVRSNNIPLAELLSEGRGATVTGRVKEYKGNRYLEAEKIEVR